MIRFATSPHRCHRWKRLPRARATAAASGRGRDNRQFLKRHFDVATLQRVADAYERAVPWHGRWLDIG